MSRLGSFKAVLTKSLYVTWHGSATEQSGGVVGLANHLLGNVKELVVLLLLPSRLAASREKHLDMLVEVSVLEELAVVLQEADQLLPGGTEDETTAGTGLQVSPPADIWHLIWIFHLLLPNHL